MKKLVSNKKYMPFDHTIHSKQRTKPLIESSLAASNIHESVRLASTISHIQLEMERLLKSSSAASNISESIRLANAISHIQLDTIKLFSDQYSAIFEKTAQRNFATDLIALQFSLNATLQPSIDFAKLFREIISPLPIAQIDFLSKIAIPKIDFSSIAQQLTVESQFCGEFAWEEEQVASRNEEIQSDEITETINDRLKIIHFLPRKIIDAIAENPELMHGLEPREFEELIADLLYSLEFENIILTPRSCDGGRDVLATKVISGIPLLFSFECKRYRRKIGLEKMRGLLGSVTHSQTKANKGVLVTTSSFTRGAKNFVLSEPLIDGKDFNDLVTWLNTYKHGNRSGVS